MSCVQMKIERNHWGVRDDCAISHVGSAGVFCPVEGRTYQIITQTGDVQKYVTFEKDISKETQENDYEVLLQ